MLASLVEGHAGEVAGALVALLRACPDVVSTRKELMVLTRHLLGTVVRTRLAGEGECIPEYSRVFPSDLSVFQKVVKGWCVR
jgi:hypothetical protein